MGNILSTQLMLHNRRHSESRLVFYLYVESLRGCWSVLTHRAEIAGLRKLERLATRHHCGRVCFYCMLTFVTWLETHSSAFDWAPSTTSRCAFFQNIYQTSTMSNARHMLVRCALYCKTAVKCKITINIVRLRWTPVENELSQLVTVPACDSRPIK